MKSCRKSGSTPITSRRNSRGQYRLACSSRLAPTGEGTGAPRPEKTAHHDEAVYEALTPTAPVA
jgi:hypothetical protein